MATGERVVLVVAGQHGSEQLAVRTDDRRRLVPLDALVEHGGADTGGHRGASRLAADHWMTVERGARAVGDFAGERQQVEAVARREEAEEFVLGHDFAVRTEPPRARNRMTVPRHQPRREIVHAQVADEHLVRRVRARRVPVTQVRAEVLDGLVDLTQHTERLRAESDEAGDVSEDEGDRADHRHSVRCHPRDHTFWAALNAR